MANKFVKSLFSENKLSENYLCIRSHQISFKWFLQKYQEYREYEEFAWVVEFLKFKLVLNAKVNVASKYWELPHKIDLFCVRVGQINPFRPNPGRGEKIKLNSYFHTFLWSLKRCYEGHKGFHKTFWATTKKCENKKN